MGLFGGLIGIPAALKGLIEVALIKADKVKAAAWNAATEEAT